MTDAFDGGAAGGSTDFRKRYDPHQTYEKLLNKRHLDLAKTALYEKQALQLTKKFMSEQHEIEREKEAKRVELESRLYEKSMKKVEETEAAEKLMDKLAKEEKQKIRAVIREKDEKKGQLAEQKKEAEEQRLWFIQGRKKYDKLQAEKRAELLADNTDEKRKKILDKEEKYNEFAKERKMEEDSNKKIAQDKQVAALKKVEERRRAAELEVAKKLKEQHNQAEEKRKSANDRRKEVQHRQVAAVKDSAATRLERLGDRQGQLADEREELHIKLMEKEETMNQKLEDMQESLREQREEKAQKKAEAFYTKWTTRAENDEAKARETAQKFEDKHSKPILSVMSSLQSEIADENVKAQKEYVRLRNELERQELKMRTRKKFKGVTEKAENLDESGGDPKCTPSRVTRMRALFNMYFAEKQTPKDSINYDKLTVQKKQKVFGIRKMRCGLCEMDYISDNLPGIATRATIQKLRKGWMSKTDDPAIRGGTAAELESSPREGEKDSGAPHNATLYDKVRLCAFCFQFVRQHNRQQTQK